MANKNGTIETNCVSRYVQGKWVRRSHTHTREHRIAVHHRTTAAMSTRSVYGSGPVRHTTYASLNGLRGMPSNGAKIDADDAGAVMRGMFGTPQHDLQMDQNGRVRDISDVARAWSGVMQVPTDFVIKQLSETDTWQSKLMPTVETNATGVEWGGIEATSVLLDEVAFRTQARAFGLQSSSGSLQMKFLGRQIHTLVGDLKTADGIREWQTKIVMLFNAVVATQCYMIGLAIATSRPAASSRTAAYYREGVSRSAMADLLALESMFTGAMNKHENGVAMVMGYLLQSMAGRGADIEADTWIISSGMTRFMRKIEENAGGRPVHVSKPAVIDAMAQISHDAFSSDHTVGLLAINDVTPYVDAPAGRSHRALREIEIQDFADTDKMVKIPFSRQFHAMGLVENVRDTTDWVLSKLGSEVFGTASFGDQLRDSGLREPFITTVMNLKRADKREAMQRFAYLAGEDYGARNAPSVVRRRGSRGSDDGDASRTPRQSPAAAAAPARGHLIDGYRYPADYEGRWVTAGYMRASLLNEATDRLNADAESEEGVVQEGLQEQVERGQIVQRARYAFGVIGEEDQPSAEHREWWRAMADAMAVNPFNAENARAVMRSVPQLSGGTSGHYVTTYHGEKLRVSNATQGAYADAPRPGTQEYTPEYDAFKQRFTAAMEAGVGGWAGRHETFMTVVAHDMFKEISTRNASQESVDEAIGLVVGFVRDLTAAMYHAKDLVARTAYDHAAFDKNERLKAIDRMLQTDPVDVLEEVHRATEDDDDVFDAVARLATGHEARRATAFGDFAAQRSGKRKRGDDSADADEKDEEDEEDDSDKLRRYFEKMPMSGSVLFVIYRFDLLFPWNIAVMRPDIVLRTGNIALVDSTRLGNLFTRGPPSVTGNMNPITGEISAGLTVAMGAGVTNPNKVSVLRGAVVDNILSGGGVDIVTCDAASVSNVHAARATQGRAGLRQSRSVYCQLLPAGYAMPSSAVDISDGSDGGAHPSVSEVGSHLEQLPWTQAYAEHWGRNQSTVGRRPGIGSEDIKDATQNPARNPNSVVFCDKMMRKDLHGNMVLATTGGGHFGEYRHQVGKAFRGLSLYPVTNPAALQNAQGAGHPNPKGMLATMRTRL